ncbi:uncharacterized protein LOC130929448 isoform X2 [Corythoichthys intestinalis]|uniref:uncharacterized protein LOC130929448 isoform X2 n=1 Tax=Corythoichthys intestinalis TaxID=161448 RepID=UPI0025A511D6|nr:uncharacterized protein LOC130929448 isoform X2 [Corythoichthys intestinalis]
MQACAPSWDALAGRVQDPLSARNPCQYQTCSGAGWPTLSSGQDIRCYQNVPCEPWNNITSGPQGRNYQFASYGVCHYMIEQNSSTCSTGVTSCDQSDMVAYQNPSPPSWHPLEAVCGNSVVTEHYVHSSGFYQKSLPPYSQTRICTSGQSFTVPNTNQTLQHQPATVGPLAESLQSYTRNYLETPMQAIQSIKQKLLTQARMRTCPNDNIQMRMREEAVPMSKQSRSYSYVSNPKTRTILEGVLAGGTLVCNASQGRNSKEPEIRFDKQHEQPASGKLKSLPTQKWTRESLKLLIRRQMKSPPSFPQFDYSSVMNLFWENRKLLAENLRKEFFTNLMVDAHVFCEKHVTTDTVVLLEAKCDLNLSGVQVLRDGDCYSEPPYTSVWRNVNQHLDDIDKEFGFDRNFLHQVQLMEPLTPSGPATPLPEAKPASLEELRREQKERQQELEEAQSEPKMESAAFVSHSEDPDDVYSFIIQVLPQEEAKAIHEHIHNAEEATALPSNSSQKKHNNDLEDQVVEIECEDHDCSLPCLSERNQSPDASFVTEQTDNQEMGNVAPEDNKELEKTTVEGDQAMLKISRQKDDRDTGKDTQQEVATVSLLKDAQESGSVSGHANDRVMEKISRQKHVKDVENLSQPLAFLPSKNSCPSEMWPLQDRPVKVLSKKQYQGERLLCLAAKRLATLKRKVKRAKQSGIHMLHRKRLKTKHLGMDFGKKSKEALRASRKQPVELALFGSARRKHSQTPIDCVPEVVSVSTKRSLSKQKIYDKWRLPPTKLDGQSKDQSMKKFSMDMLKKEPPLPSLLFRKNNGRVSLILKEKRSELDVPRRQATDGMRKTTVDYSHAHEDTVEELDDVVLSTLRAANISDEMVRTLSRDDLRDLFPGPESFFRRKAVWHAFHGVLEESHQEGATGGSTSTSLETHMPKTSATVKTVCLEHCTSKKVAKLNFPENVIHTDRELEDVRKEYFELAKTGQQQKCQLSKKQRCRLLRNTMTNMIAILRATGNKESPVYPSRQEITAVAKRIVLYYPMLEDKGESKWVTTFQQLRQRLYNIRSPWKALHLESTPKRQLLQQSVTNNDQNLSSSTATLDFSSQGSKTPDPRSAESAKCGAGFHCCTRESLFGFQRFPFTPRLAKTSQTTVGPLDL